MRDRNHNISPVSLDLGQVEFSAFNDIAGYDFSAQFITIPIHDLWRQQANDTDFDAPRLPVFRFDIAF